MVGARGDEMDQFCSRDFRESSRYFKEAACTELRAVFARLGQRGEGDENRGILESIFIVRMSVRKTSIYTGNTFDQPLGMSLACFQGTSPCNRLL